jgi:MerR family transcriptional regulator, mercuric resistance operon regulatory protein
MKRSYTIGRLAVRASVPVETIRYYQRLKLVPEPARPLGGVRRYTEADAESLRFIKRAQRMGFSLSEISSLLRLQTRRSCRDTRDLAATKLHLIDARIRELRNLRIQLADLVAECDANTQGAKCPVLRKLAS